MLHIDPDQMRIEDASSSGKSKLGTSTLRHKSDLTEKRRRQLNLYLYYIWVVFCRLTNG